MRLGVDGSKIPEAVKRGPIGSLEHGKEIGMSGLFFRTILDMSPTLDRGELKAIREKADELPYRSRSEGERGLIQACRTNQFVLIKPRSPSPRSRSTCVGPLPGGEGNSNGSLRSRFIAAEISTHTQ